MPADASTLPTGNSFRIIGSLCTWYNRSKRANSTMRTFSVKDLLCAAKSVNADGIIVMGKFTSSDTACSVSDYVTSTVKTMDYIMNPQEQLEFINDTAQLYNINTYVLNYLYAIVNCTYIAYHKEKWFPKCISDYQTLCEINRVRAKYTDTPLPKRIRDGLVTMYKVLVTTEYDRLVSDSAEIRARKTKYLEECNREKLRRQREYRDEVYDATHSLNANEEDEQVAMYNQRHNLCEEKIQVSEQCIIDRDYADAEVSERKYDELVFTFKGGMMYKVPDDC